MKKSIIRIPVIFFLLIGLATPKAAQAIELFGFDIFSAEPNFCDISFRKQAASEMAKHFERLNSSLPNLSPSEKEWIEAELKSQNNERVQNALTSTEYNLKEAGNFTLVQLNSKFPNVANKYGKLWWCEELTQHCYTQALTSMMDIIVARFAMPSTGNDPDCK